MRLIFAALFTFVGLFLCVGLFLRFEENLPKPILAICIATVFLLLIGISLKIFNRPGQDHLMKMSPAQIIKDLESKNFLDRESYKATRSFSVEETEDEGSHYFIELNDGRVLYLTGQYLYDFEPVNDDDLSQPRSFPNTDFTILRHKTERYVLDISCVGSVLEPEFMAPTFDHKLLKSMNFPQDGDMIEFSYKDLCLKFQPIKA